MKAAALACLLALSAVWTSRAAVFLSTDLPGATLLPGETFTMTLLLQITGSEQVESISYYWATEPAGSAFFRLTERDTTGSLISFLFHDDAAVLESPGNLLDPVNALNLGGLTEDDPLSSGTWLVANYAFQVDPAATPGSYTLTTFSPPGTGWTTPPPGAQNFVFSQQAAFVVTVVPEPAGLLLLVFALGVGLVLRSY